MTCVIACSPKREISENPAAHNRKSGKSGAFPCFRGIRRLVSRADQAGTLIKSSSQRSPRKCRYCSARSRSARRPGGSSTSSIGQDRVLGDVAHELAALDQALRADSVRAHLVDIHRFAVGHVHAVVVENLAGLQIALGDGADFDHRARQRLARASRGTARRERSRSALRNARGGTG